MIEPDATRYHIRRVGQLLSSLCGELYSRALNHDLSKFSDAEWPYIEMHGQALNDVIYGSDEYKARLKALEPQREHHYKHNRHHMEYYTDGAAGMTLIDLLEMLCDWKAASERRPDGDLLRSIEVNRKALGPLAGVLETTAHYLGWGRKDGRKRMERPV